MDPTLFLYRHINHVGEGCRASVNLWGRWHQPTVRSCLIRGYGESSDPVSLGPDLIYMTRKHFLSKFDGPNGSMLAIQPLLIAAIISPVLLCLDKKLYEGVVWRPLQLLAVRS